jgi:hypothetical protein
VITAEHFRDPVMFAKLLWPHVYFYNKQKEIMYSVRDNVETLVCCIRVHYAMVFSHPSSSAHSYNEC